MGKRIEWKKLVRVIIFGILFLMCFQYLNNVLYNKSDAKNYRPFYDMEENFDVLFLGTSVTVSGVSPLDLWNEFGIVSFNLANNGQSIPNNYYALKSALETQQPRLVVLDTSYIFQEDVTGGSREARLRQLIDNMPWGRTKVEAILDLVPMESWGDFILPVVYYHERWKELSASDFRPITSINRGGELVQISKGSDGEIFDTSVFAEELNILPKEDVTDYPELSEVYIQKILDLCQSRGIDVLFVTYPCYAQGDTNHGDGEHLQRMWNQVYVTAEENGVNYIHGLHDKDKIGFDFVEDLRDWRHINVSGNRKVTRYIGQYIQEIYQIPDRRGEEGLEYWNSDFEKLEEYRQELLTAE